MAWQKYPRPQLKRDDYYILNGEWELNGQTITVPFPPQSRLSGYQGETGDKLVYRKNFTLPEAFTKERVLLHFGAVDQICEVWLNGEKVGAHEGGYLPFTMDITNAVKRTVARSINVPEKGSAARGAESSCEECTSVENRLEVRVTDTLSHDYPYGKQCKNRGGMWYTPVSGIWQTVWLENVSETYIEKITLTPDLEGVKVQVNFAGGCFVNWEDKDLPGCGCMDRKDGHESMCEITIPLENGREICKSFTRSQMETGEVYISLKTAAGKEGREIPNTPIFWTPENPHLYTMNITYGNDCAETYFALRTIAICEMAGVNRVCLNGEPIFLHGVLDQGYYEDGIFLPKEEAEYERDILRMKELGLNMLRKHIKVEPECFYYYCDVHGMLVVQDMVNNGPYTYVPMTVLPTLGFKKRKDTGGNPEETRKKIFREHTRDTIDHLYNHPCIVVYTIFNEGWGQFDSDSVYEAVKAQDPTRLADSTSGWFAQKKNDFDSEHIYFRSKKLKPGVRPMFLSECGGFSLLIEDHRFLTDKSYGYGACKSKEELTERIMEMYRVMVLPAIEKGLCGCVYTQLSDVEDEINGLYTYDREVCKVVPEKFVELAAKIVQEIRK